MMKVSKEEPNEVMVTLTVEEAEELTLALGLPRRERFEPETLEQKCVHTADRLYWKLCRVCGPCVEIPEGY